MKRQHALAESYGGMLWNEHGKGHRSEYHPAYFGPVLYTALGRVKRAFDPYNQFNPGKIVALDDDRVPLASMRATTRGVFDRQIGPPERQRFAGALHCNGNGVCFSYEPGDVMCPSYRATRDRLHSPKGRAGAMSEWLRQLALAGTPTPTLSPASGPLWLRAIADRPSQAAIAQAAPDFSHEVWEAMDSCLSCRACATQCPIRVNVPDFKARVLALYHGRHARPLGDYALALLERGAQLAGYWPTLANALMARPGFRNGWKSRSGWSICRLSRRPACRAVCGAMGFLPEFERQAQAAQRQLEMLASYDRPMIGLEPSVTLAYADDYPPATGRAAPAIHILESWLASTLSSLESSRRPTTANPADYVLFNHCTATARSSASATQWQQAFAAIRAELSIPRLGCCGMSGVCGHEARHRDTSEAIFALSWQAALADHAGQALVPGYSCRSQAERLTGRRAMHPATALLSRLS